MGNNISSSPCPLDSYARDGQSISDRFCLLFGRMEEDATTVWGPDIAATVEVIRTRDRLPRRQSEGGPATGS